MTEIHSTRGRLEREEFDDFVFQLQPSKQQSPWLDIATDVFPGTEEFSGAHYQIVFLLHDPSSSPERDKAEAGQSVTFAVEAEKSGPVEFWLQLLDPDTSDRQGTLRCTDEDAPEWARTSDPSFGLTIRFSYDHEGTIRESRVSPKTIDRRRGVLDRTTPGVRERWLLDDSVSSVVCDGETLYASLSGENRRVSAFDPDSSDRRWSQSRASGKLATDGHALVAVTRSKTYLLDPASGDVRRVFDPDDPTNQPGTVWEPSRDSRTDFPASLVSVGTRAGHIYTLDGETGQIQWNRNLGAASQQPHCAAHGRLYVSSSEGTVAGLDAVTGATVWEYEFDSAPRAVSVRDGRLFVACDGSVLAIDIAERTVVWRQEFSHSEPALAVSGSLVVV